MQALACGVSTGVVRARRVQGAWASPESGVYVAAAAPSSFLRVCWVAHLAAGPRSVVSHEAAAAIWRLSIENPRPVVTLPHGDHPRLRLAAVRQSGDLRPPMVRRLGGLPVTSPARTLLDLGASVGVDALGRLVDEAITQRVTCLADLRSLAHQLSFRGRRGMGRVAAVLDERGPGGAPPASELERIFRQTLRAAGLSEGVRQVAITGRQGRAHVVDVLYPVEMLIVELDGLGENVVADPGGTVDNLFSVMAVRRRQLGRAAA